jgi:hypothetical protein
MGAPSKTRSKSLKGNRNGCKPEGTQRVNFGCTVSPETLAYVESLARANKVSKGKTVDLLAEYHKRNSF